MFVVLGIDPGVSRCGYGCLAGGVGIRATVVAAGVITTPPSDPLPDRLAALHADLLALITELRPDGRVRRHWGAVLHVAAPLR